MFVRARQMKSYQFRRQRPVLNYITDFMCKELRLVIEVDGITHDSKLERDEQRTKELMQAGFNVLRFTDEEVLTNIQGVAREIERIIDEMTSPNPLQRGTHPVITSESLPTARRLGTEAEPQATSLSPSGGGRGRISTPFGLKKGI
jgi:very-short-patch-repair endonuclease